MSSLLARGRLPRPRLLIAAAIGGAAAISLHPGAADAAVTAAPNWAIHSVSMPTYVSPTAGGNVVVLANNDGAAPTEAANTITVTDSLPAGVTVTKAAIVEKPAHEHEPTACAHTTTTVSCTYSEALPANNTAALVVEIAVAASGGAGTLPAPNAATVSGGGAIAATARSPITVSAAPPPFGLSDFYFNATDAAGTEDIQAGSHPNALTVGFDLNSVTDPRPGTPSILPVESVKSVAVDLPLGLVGNPQTAEKCPQYLVVIEDGTHCPAASVIGAVALSASGASYLVSQPANSAASVSPLFNVVPEHGYPAEFAFNYLSHAAFAYATVTHTAAGYALRTTVPAVTRSVVFKGVQLTFFGDPAVQDGGATLPAAFFSTSSDCAAPTTSAATLRVNPWAAPEHTIAENAPMPLPAGCNRLQFEPTITVKPQTTQVDTPTGVTVDLKVPQNEDAGGLATPDLKDATVTLPPGMSVAPPAANGLRGCPATGPEGINLYAEGPVDSQEPQGIQHLLPGHCPPASAIGTVKITTPLLPAPLEGRVYLAQPKCGGEGQSECTEADATNGNLFSLYIEAEGSGVNLKLPGRVAASPTTGQLTTTFTENPQFPFSELVLTLNAGPNAPLANPPTCGPATTTSDLVPWSSPETHDATPTSFYSVDSNGAGGACPPSPPFTPTFNAGTIAAESAASSPFTLTLNRHDGEQNVSALAVRMPPGLVGMLSAVPLCQEPQASAGTCPEASRIGTTTVAAGAGANPFWISGRVYLTAPYNGAPFGLTVVVPAKAGPFNLGNVIVRAAINVNRTTAAITVTSGPLPQIKDGVPFRLKTINVTIDRPGFMLNPTNCEQQAITGTVAAAQGAAASVSTPFAVGRCSSLPFKPSFTVSTQAKTSKASGASLDVKVAFPTRGEANIRAVKVDLPKQLPSRLTTLQKACPVAVFDANPAHCAAESIVGIAKAQTPVLPVTLSGPAYLVSHAAEAFPQLVVVLQGDGVRVDLAGQTFIRKGITSSNFATVPDVPVSSFELYLPEGRFSALAAYGDLCKLKLQMPTKITGQNGAVIKQTTVIKVTGCPKAKKASRAKKARGNKHATHAGKRKRSA